MSKDSRRHYFVRDSREGLAITEGDLDILRAVWRFRFLTSEHLLLLTGRKQSTVQSRLRLLYHAGFLDRPRAQRDYNAWSSGSRPLVYGLGDKGADLLSEALGLERGAVNWQWKNQKVKRPFLNHTLAVADVLIDAQHRSWERDEALTLIEELGGVRPVRWRVEVPAYGLSPAGQTTIEPDAVFTVGDGAERSLFFLEVDRGTMPVESSNPDRSSIRRKLIAYHESWKQGLHREQFGISGVRVLFVGRSEERRVSMRAALGRVIEEQPRPRRRGGHLLFGVHTPMIEAGIFAYPWHDAGGRPTYLKRVIE